MAWLKAGDWIEVAEAAEILGVSKRRVQAIITDGKNRLPSATLIGKSYVVLRSDAVRLAKIERPGGRPPKDGERR